MLFRHKDKSPTLEAWKLIRCEQWSGLSRLLRDRKGEMSVTRRRYVREMRTSVPMLSFALWKGAPYVIVEEFVRQYPESLETADKKGRLPLHLACMQSRSPGIIDLLLEHNFLQVVVQDQEGNSPLHYAVIAACDSLVSAKHPFATEASKLESHLDVLTSLLGSYPQGTRISNKKSETPLSLSQHLEQRQRKDVYKMLSCANHTFNKKFARKLSDEFTAPSSSYFMDLDFGSSVLETEDEAANIDWVHAERQAVGERPSRRNAIVIRNKV